MNNDTEQPTEATTTDAAPASTTTTTPADVNATNDFRQLDVKDQPSDVIDNLGHDLHNLILVTISAVYYLDCFAILFLLRFVGHNQLKRGGIQPDPREYWNHGGALVDFVGEKPTTKFKVLCLDCLIVGLQMLHLALYYQKSTLTESKATENRQDLDAEEAGVLRTDVESSPQDQEGVELQPMLGSVISSGEGAGKPKAGRDNTILIRRRDWGQVFVHSAPATQENDENSAILRGFLDRLSAIRARRDAVAAQTTGAVGV